MHHIAVQRLPIDDTAQVFDKARSRRSGANSVTAQKREAFWRAQPLVAGGLGLCDQTIEAGEQHFTNAADRLRVEITARFQLESVVAHRLQCFKAVQYPAVFIRREKSDVFFFLQNTLLEKFPKRSLVEHLLHVVHVMQSVLHKDFERISFFLFFGSSKVMDWPRCMWELG